MEIKDLRSRLSVVENPLVLRRQGIYSRKERPGAPRGVVFHYNGPALPFAGNPERELAFIINVDVPNHQQRIGADSLMYHYVVLGNGDVYQTRDEDLIAWHAAAIIANTYHLGVHFPIGGSQDVTPEQWRAGIGLFEYLSWKYGFGKDALTGHREWSKTACPGPHIMRRIREYRGQPAVKPEPYSLWEATEVCNVRQAPRRTFLDGRPVPIVRKIKAGERLLADLVKTDGDVEIIGGDRRWLHLADGSGFVKVGNYLRRLPL